MKRGDKVRVKLPANPPDMEKNYGDWVGTVVADSAPGEMVQVKFEEEFDEVSDTHQFQESDLEKIEDHTLPGE
ncbi:MAG: hypothetical protein ACLPPV_03060 [Candidatus Korobacteraceae bacterium]|jgi:hypothetical protein